MNKKNCLFSCICMNKKIFTWVKRFSVELSSNEIDLIINFKSAYISHNSHTFKSYQFHSFFNVNKELLKFPTKLRILSAWGLGAQKKKKENYQCNITELWRYITSSDTKWKLLTNNN